MPTFSPASKWFRLLVSGAVLALSASAFAFPVTVSVGSPQAFNFDLTGQTPAPPYTGVGINSQGGDHDLGEFFIIEIFDDLDLGGSLVRTFGPFDGNNNGGGLGFLVLAGAPGLSDGLFSARLSTTAGAYRLDSVQAYGQLIVTPPFGALDTPFVSGVPVSVNVPEPGSAALVVLALAALGGTARRLKRQPAAAAT